MTINRYQLPEGEGVQEKPLVFGNSAYDSERLDDLDLANRQWDAAYVPGYSEMRVENEKLVRDGKQPVPMPALQWVRITRPDGATTVSETDEGMVEWSRKGYRACGVADLKRYGYGWPPTAGSGPRSDGTIRRGGDLALFIIDEDRADRNRRKRAQELRDEAGFVPESETGEVYPMDDERRDYRGSDIQRAIEQEIPNL